ncbi:MAG: bacterioferritin [bacterium]|nr:bacterioferritin [bacterium]
MTKNADAKMVIELLNDVLSAELTAINQYFLHAELCNHWGYVRMYKLVRKQSIDEMKHAEELIERILHLDGIPNVQRLFKVNIGETVPEQLKLDLALEEEAVLRLNKAIEACRNAGDNGSMILLQKILISEEEHVDWLDSQLQLIKTVGEANYLTQQIIGNE